MDDLGTRIRERIENRGEDAAQPARMYGFYRNRVPTTAMYVEAAGEAADRELDRDEATPIIVHNFQYYEEAMRRWNVGVIEALVLNELHELAHWVITDEERADLHRRSVERGVPDGRFINPPLLDVIDWVVGEYPAVHDAGSSRWHRLLEDAVGYLRDLMRGAEMPVQPDRFEKRTGDPACYPSYSASVRRISSSCSRVPSPRASISDSK